MSQVAPRLVDAGDGRRRELDRVRVVMVLGLVAFHAALVFDTRDDFYVKNDVTVDLTGVAAGFVVVWAMPLLFASAGAAAAHSVQRRGPSRFVGERLVRLGVPLVVATLLLAPLPQWLRARSTDDTDAHTYTGFWRRFLDVGIDLSEFPFVIQGEHFELGHLWFLLLLILGSLVVAAVAALPGAVSMLTGLSGRVAGRRGAVLVPALLVGAACAPRLEEAYAAGSRWAYLVTFAAGFALLADAKVRRAVHRERWWALALGLVAFNAAGLTFLSVDDALVSPSSAAALGRAAFGAAGWCFVVAILGQLDRPTGGASPACADAAASAGRRRPFLPEAGELVLPVYVLHQPVVVGVASVVVPFALPAWAKYAVIVVASLVLTLALAAAAARTTTTRVLLGMRVRRDGLRSAQRSSGGARGGS